MPVLVEAAVLAHYDCLGCKHSDIHWDDLDSEVALRIGLAVGRSCFAAVALDIHSFVVEGSVDTHHTAVEAVFHNHMAVAARVVLVVDILRIAAVVEDSLHTHYLEEAGYILLDIRPDILDLDSQTSALACDC